MMLTHLDLHGDDNAHSIGHPAINMLEHDDLQALAESCTIPVEYAFEML